MSDGRKVLRLLNCSAQLQYLPTGQCSINWQAVAYIDSPDEWPIWREKFAAPDGLPIYESPGILEETVAVLQSDLEKERQRYKDLERDFAVFKVESHAAMKRQEDELRQLRSLRADLDHIAMWGGAPGGKIGP